MTKEIIVNAGELESRVAILENGRLMELHVERDPKIVGNIYKGRVTKVLKGMDAAFVDIGVERNAFLAASDVVPEDEDTHEGGRHHRREVPPITQLLHGNQEVLVQVVRAPMGTKGARITTRLSLPGRYLVLMMNSGGYVGVSRKLENSTERSRLRTIATKLRPEGYSLIVRTEAEGKTEEELQQDVSFLVEMAQRLERKAAEVQSPALIHGDLTLIFRIMRDAFTRDVNRVVVDSPATYENILELVGMIAPRQRNRIFLYDETLPVFHAYNVEPEIERTLRRKVWLPSGGSLIIDQAEALTAIDVNTGRFVGSVELAETVLATNLQAADEAARQLRLRDLGGIIVVDFIDMDNPKHRQQVMRAFEEALRRDRAKIKVHSISALGLVEMTRKRTGESLAGLLTEPCPYCSGIGRVQNALTMALRIEREIAATASVHPDTEAYLITAHPRVVASILGYEGEAHHDLEQYIEHPVYLRIDEGFHPNTYHLERLTLEQALAAVQHLEEGEVVEAQVVNPDPEVSLSPLLLARGLYLVAPDLDAPVGARVKVRVQQAGTSMAIAEPLAEELRGIRGVRATLAIERPPLVPESVLPAYLREERSAVPPRGLPLLAPTADMAMPVEEEEAEAPLVAEQPRSRQRRERQRTRRPKLEVEAAPLAPELPEELVANLQDVAVPLEAEEIAEIETEGAPSEQLSRSARRRRRRRTRREIAIAVQPGETETGEDVLEVPPATELEAATGEPAEAPATEEAPVKKARRRRRGGRKTREVEGALEAPLEESPFATEIDLLEPLIEEMPAAQAADALIALLNAIPSAEDEGAEAPIEPAAPEALAAAEAVTAETEAAMPEEEAPRRRRRAPRRKRAEVEAATTEALPMPEPAAALPEPEPEAALPAPEPELALPAPEPEAALPAPEPEVTPEAAPETSAEPVEEAPKPARRRRTTSTTPRPRRTKKTAEGEAPPAREEEPPTAM